MRAKAPQLGNSAETPDRAGCGRLAPLTVIPSSSTGDHFGAAHEGGRRRFRTVGSNRFCLVTAVSTISATMDSHRRQTAPLRRAEAIEEMQANVSSLSLEGFGTLGPHKRERSGVRFQRKRRHDEATLKSVENEPFGQRRGVQPCRLLRRETGVQSGSPALRSAPVNVARSSARRNGVRSLRLEALRSGLHSSARPMPLCACSSCPASAVLAVKI